MEEGAAGVAGLDGGTSGGNCCCQSSWRGSGCGGNCCQHGVELLGIGIAKSALTVTNSNKRVNAVILIITGGA